MVVLVLQVSDFGLARLIAPQGRITTNTHGTVTHMPRELLTGGEMSPAVVGSTLQMRMLRHDAAHMIPPCKTSLGRRCKSGRQQMSSSCASAALCCNSPSCLACYEHRFLSGFMLLVQYVSSFGMLS